MALSVRAVERALDILLCFSAEEPVRSLTQVAESVHLSKPTVHRLLAALEKKRFIEKDQATSQYRLGIHGQLGIAGSALRVPSPEKALKEGTEEIREPRINTPRGSSTVPAFVAAAIPKNPQVPTILGNR
jgi:DNA-binding Lrp family transcriptional regulator